MISCIIGAVAYCTSAFYIDGPITQVRPMPQHAAWNYAVYGAPILAPQMFPIAFPVVRRG